MEDEQTATQLDAELNDGVAEEPQEEADQQDGDLGDAAADDAEGEDNEGEQQNQYEEDGFIVDELSGDEEDKPSKMRSRLKKKKEKKRKRVLEEEDYELMQENLGYKVPRPKLSKQEKNLAPVVEQPATENGDEDAGNKAEALGRLLFDDDGADDADEAPAPEAPPRRRVDDDIFDSDEEDDFIVSDEEGGAGEDPEARAARRKKRAAVSYISGDSLLKAQDLYDFSEYLSGPVATEEGADVEVEGAGPKPVDKYAQYRKQGFEPGMLAAKFMMPEDDEIREADLPERLQLRPSARRPAPSDAELAEEASWIFDSALATTVDLRDGAVMKIVNVLRLILIDHMEIPYIQHYRKDQWDPELKPAHLWEIYDWDQRWVVFSERKNRLRALFETRTELLLDAATVELCSKEEQLSDFVDLWQSRSRDLQQAEPEPELDAIDAPAEGRKKKKVKRPEQRDLHNVARRTDAARFVQHYGLSLKDLSENVSNSYLLHEPEDEQRFPEQVAQDYVCAEYKRPEDVIRAARSILAYDVSADHNIRTAMRVIYNTHVAISTDPTSEGVREIDAFHRYRFVKRLREKPLHRFVDAEFLLLLQAVQQGMITMRVELTSDCERKMATQLEQLFLSSSSNEYAEKWNEERKKVIGLALSKFLLPVFERQVLSKARQEAELFVARTCAKALEGLLLAGPYEPPRPPGAEHERSRTHVHILGVAVSDETTALAMLDPHGEVKETLTLNAGVRSAQDVQLAVEFIQQHGPTVIAIGADSMRAADVLQSMLRVLEKIRNDCSASQIPNPCEKTRCIFADASAARIFENSPRSAEFLRELSPMLRKAVSVGRRLLDPLLELCGLYSQHDEILHLSLHPLQGLVDKNLLRKQYERCYINVVNAVGVDFNRVAQHRWMSPILQFVCGLGPRKADALLTAVRRVGGRIDRRDDLKRRRWMSDCVYRNAAGFLYIKGVSKDSDEMDDYVASLQGNVLDQTRIHPDDYMYAEKIAQDALGNAAEDEDDEADPVERIMSDPARLLAIDFEYFASILPPGKIHTLRHMKNEFHNPGADPRPEYQDPSGPQVFTMLTGETRESLKIGSLVNVTVIRPGPITRVRLDCGLEGEIDLQELSDNLADRARASDVVSSNSVIPARIISLGIDQMPFVCKLSSKHSILSNVLQFAVVADRQTTYLLETPEDLKGFIAEDEAQRAQNTREATVRNNMTSIRIAHPLFHSWTYQQCVDFLADKEPGTCVVRPSTQTPNVVKILLKILPNVNIDLEAQYIPEADRAQRSDPQFKVKETPYMDLNDLIVHYVDKIAMYADDITRHRKYRDQPREELEKLVVSASEAGRKEYYVRASTSSPGVFELIVCPSKRARRILISVTADGLKAFGRTFHEPDQLFDYFKKHTKDIIEKLNADELAKKNRSASSNWNAPATADTWAAPSSENWGAPAAQNWGAPASDNWGSSATAQPAAENWGASASSASGWGSAPATDAWSNNNSNNYQSTPAAAPQHSASDSAAAAAWGAAPSSGW